MARTAKKHDNSFKKKEAKKRRPLRFGRATPLLNTNVLWNRYQFWDAEKDDDAAFENRLDMVCREIGDRGKPLLSEAIPPHEPAPEPTRQLATAPAPAPAPAPAVTSERQIPAEATDVIDSMSPNAQHSSAVAVLANQPMRPAAASTITNAGRAMDVSSFLDLVDRMQTQTDKLREEAFSSKLQATEAKLRVDMYEVRQRDQQLNALQSRVESLHGAKLLTDEDLHVVEDAVADAECTRTEERDRVDMLIALSLRMSSDRAFARQLQRKKWL
eukprot:COSAG02_NODE_5468_length_4297_cov_3.717008_5_plen_272_part_00